MSGQSLRLTPFEEYLLWEDRPEQPCWIIVKQRFQGTFDRPVLQQSVDWMASRHPLLRSSVRRRWDGALFWQELPTYCLQIEWIQPPAGPWPKWQPFDLFRQAGFRILAWEEAGFTVFIFHFHHAVCDGKALREIVLDLFGDYARRQGAMLERPELDIALLRSRNRFGGDLNGKLRMLPNLLLGLWVAWRFQRKEVAPLVPLKPPAEADRLPSHYPALASRRLDGAVFRAARDEAMRLKVSVNDLLLRDLAHTIGLWRQEQKIGDPMDWIRLVLPVDLRKPADRALPAANVTSLVTLDRRQKSLFNRERLLQRTHEEMEWVKHRWLRYTFWASLRLNAWWPGGIRHRARRTRCQGTIIFANHCQFLTRSPLNQRHGKLAVPGATLEEMNMVSPLRPGTAAALVVGNYAESFFCELHYDERIIKPEQADRFVQIFSEQLALYSRR